MPSLFELPDFDAHEDVHFFHDEASGLRAIIAIHSTHLGPASGGTRFWHYADSALATTDALRLSRGMSYKNAMAGLPLGGGKGVILAGPARQKTPAMLAAYGRMVDHLGGRYVTGEDVGITVPDIVAVAKETDYVAGLPATSEGAAGGDPGPYTATGVFLGIREAVRHRLNRDDLNDVHVALQGVGSVGGGVARRLAEAGARLTVADVDRDRAEAVAKETGAAVVDGDAILSVEADVLSPNALGAILNERTIPALNVKIVAGGANNQLAVPADSKRLHDRGILFAPDYVINAGGIISLCVEYCRLGDAAEAMARVEQIPDRLAEIWRESEASAKPSADIADAIAQRLIGRD